MNSGLTEQQIALIRLLQEDFPICDRPFGVLAEKLGVSEQEVLQMTEELRKEGRLKRIAAAIYHRQAGYRVNSMLVWDVPEERLVDAAAEAVAFPQVTHCYARKRVPEFDYNLYTMVHETTEERFETLLHELEDRIKPLKCCSLRTLRELKKVGMRYFMEEADRQ